jgi:hypothetical protein
VEAHCALADEEHTEEDFFICQNDSCKKAFAKPLKAFDVSGNSGEVYEACPFCLSKVKAASMGAPFASDKKTPTSPEGTVACVHHLGYLCERSEKDQIPDECILCKDVVSCMLHSLSR